MPCGGWIFGGTRQSVLPTLMAAGGPIELINQRSRHPGHPSRVQGLCSATSNAGGTPSARGRFHVWPRDSQAPVKELLGAGSPTRGGRDTRSYRHSPIVV